MNYTNYTNYTFSLSLNITSPLTPPPSSNANGNSDGFNFEENALLISLIIIGVLLLIIVLMGRYIMNLRSRISLMEQLAHEQTIHGFGIASMQSRLNKKHHNNTDNNNNNNNNNSNNNSIVENHNSSNPRSVPLAKGQPMIKLAKSNSNKGRRSQNRSSAVGKMLSLSQDVQVYYNAHSDDRGPIIMDSDKSGTNNSGPAVVTPLKEKPDDSQFGISEKDTDSSNSDGNLN